MANNIFNSVQVRKFVYNKFNLSHTNKFTADLGTLYPTLLLECNAGEFFRCGLQSIIRTQPLAAPILSNFYYDTYFFFVPNRLVFEQWSKFIVKGDDGNEDITKPVCLTGDFGLNKTLFMPGSLLDYLGFPSIGDNKKLGNFALDMMPINVYNLVYNEYFRDENLQIEIPLWNQSGYEDNVTIFADARTAMQSETGLDAVACAQYLNPFKLRYRAWKKDYFTSALPFVQKGPEISVSSNYFENSQVLVRHMAETASSVASAGTSPVIGQPAITPELAPYDGYSYINYFTQTSPASPILSWVDLSGLQAAVMSLEDLRTSIALMQWYELNARVGSNRYNEYLLGHFGVVSKDARLQRPEYLGSHHGDVIVSEVEQNSETTDGTPQGTLTGKGFGFDSSFCFKYKVEEPGFIIGITSIMPHAVYYQGLSRMWTRWDAFDYYDPFFDHLSEQSIRQQELFFDYELTNQETGNPFDYGILNNQDFGYTPRFAEYRFAQNELHGEFRKSLNYWVPRRKDLSAGTHLDEQFILVDGYVQGLYDTFAFPGSEGLTSPHFLCYFSYDISALRPMSKYATPSFNFNI